MLARDILHITPAQILANYLNRMFDYGGKDNYDKTIDLINLKMKTHLPYVTDKKVSTLLNVLQQQFPGKADDALYASFIQGKDDKESINHMITFYRGIGFYHTDVIGTIDEMMSPVIQWQQTPTALIAFPATILAIPQAPADSMATFRCANMKAVLNYKQRALEITLTGQMIVKAAVKSGKLLDYNAGKDSLKTIDAKSAYAQPAGFKELRFTISETGTRLIAITDQNIYYQLINEPRAN